jgi:hypothetical protein
MEGLLRAAWAVDRGCLRGIVGPAHRGPACHTRPSLVHNGPHRGAPPLPRQDISTNLVVVIGAPGSGRSALAATLAAELVAASYWGEAFWVDLQGVGSATTAGMQILSCLGLISDAPDPAQLLAWLESRSGERFGIVLAHTDKIMGGTADDQSGLMELVDRMLQVGGGCGGGRAGLRAPPGLATKVSGLGESPARLAARQRACCIAWHLHSLPPAPARSLPRPAPQACSKLQIVLVTDDHLQHAAYNARTLELQPLQPDVSAVVIRAANPDLPEVRSLSPGSGGLGLCHDSDCKVCLP